MDSKRKIIKLGDFKINEYTALSSYFVMASTKEEINQIVKAKDEGKLDELQKQYHRLKLKNIVLIGNGHNKGVSYRVGNLLEYSMKRKAEDVSKHYRDYTRTKEAQDKISHLVNVCSDVNMSWYSVLTALGFNVYYRQSFLGMRFKDTNEDKECYVIIWRENIEEQKEKADGI